MKINIKSREKLKNIKRYTKLTHEYNNSIINFYQKLQKEENQVRSENWLH